MKINETHTYKNASVEEVYALATDEAHRGEVCVAQGATEHAVTIDANVVTIVSTIAAEMPDFVKKFVGDTVKFKQTEDWADAAADGSRTADIRATIIGQPAEIKGSATLKPSGSDVDFVFEAEVKVSVPFIGKKIEPEIARAIVGMVHIQASEGDAALA